MFSENFLYLAKHRIATAKEDLDTAIDMLSMERYKAATNIAYYAIFHSMRAVLALEAVDFKKHSGVISYFRQNFIKTGVFDVLFAEIIQKASFIRNESDYSDFYIASDGLSLLHGVEVVPPNRQINKIVRSLFFPNVSPAPPIHRLFCVLSWNL